MKPPTHWGMVRHWERWGQNPDHDQSLAGTAGCSDWRKTCPKCERPWKMKIVQVLSRWFWSDQSMDTQYSIHSHPIGASKKTSYLNICCSFPKNPRPTTQPAFSICSLSGAKSFPPEGRVHGSGGAAERSAGQGGRCGVNAETKTPLQQVLSVGFWWFWLFFVVSAGFWWGLVVFGCLCCFHQLSS